MNQPLALNDEQRALVITAAQAVPARWRQRFLSAVTDMLTGTPHPTNGDVQLACGQARRAITVGIGPVNMS